VAEKRAVPRAVLWALAPLWLLAGVATSVWRVWPAPLDKVIYGISFGAIVVLGARLDLGRGRVARAMLLPGTVSYGLYLFHQPILLVAAPYLWRLELGSARLWAWSMLAGMPVLVGVGWLAHMLFERPFLRGGRFGGRPARPACSSETAPGSSAS
jgi:peptidoglycan/LPS O-acetylase OafA/YrhL